MSRQLLKEISRLQNIMGVTPRTKQLISESWRYLIGSVTDVISALDKFKIDDVVRVNKNTGYLRIDWTKVNTLGLNDEASDLLKLFDDELKVSEDIIGPPTRWKNTMGDLSSQYSRADELIQDLFAKGTASADVIRSINRMKAAANPSKFASQVANVDEFWVILKSRLSNTGQQLNKNTVASVLDLPPNSSAVDDIFDELLLYERTDELIADIGRIGSKTDDVIGIGGKTVRGDKSTIINIGADAAGTGAKGRFGKHLRRKWWAYIIGTVAADSIFGLTDDWFGDEYTETTKIKQAFNIGVKEGQPVWRQDWEKQGKTDKYKKDYLFDSETTQPTGQLLEIVKWLDGVLDRSRWDYEDVPEKAIASLYGGKQFPNKVCEDCVGTGSKGVITSILKASQVAWAWEKYTTGTGTASLYDQMKEVMKVRAGGLVGKGISSGIGDVGFEAVEQKVNVLGFGYDISGKGSEEEKTQETEKDHSDKLNEGMPNFVGRKAITNSGVKEVWCCNFPATAQVPPAVAWLNFAHFGDDSNYTIIAANKMISPGQFNISFEKVYGGVTGYMPAYTKNPQGQRSCDNVPEGKIGDFNAQIKIFNEELQKKILQKKEDQNEDY